MNILRTAITALIYLFFMTLIMGFLYPLAVTLAANLIFPAQSNGSLLSSDGIVMGSILIGQDFKSDRFFHGRPSCSSYDPMACGASNLSATNAALKKEVDKRRGEWQKKYGKKMIPEEMLYASASGLDSEISPEAALIQIERIAKARGYDEHKKVQLKEYIEKEAKPKGIDFLRIPRVNVLKLNLMLEGNDAQNNVSCCELRKGSFGKRMWLKE